MEVTLVVIVEHSCDGGVESSFDSGMELRWYRVQLLVIVKMSRVAIVEYSYDCGVESSCDSGVDLS